MKKRINITKLGENEEDRRTKIIEYITNHQGCNIQDVIRGVGDYVSRVTVFIILDSLEKVGAIRRQKDKPNSRDHKLFVDTNNPLISLPKEFVEFKRHYYPLLEIVKKEYKEQKQLTPSKPSEEDLMLLGRLGLIFVEFIRIYDCRALLVWPKQITDTESLKSLYMLFFSEVLEILGELKKVFKFVLSDLGPLTEEGILANIGAGLLGWTPIAMLELNDFFAENTMPFAQKIKDEVQGVIEYVYTIWEKDFDSYDLKGMNIERKVEVEIGDARAQFGKKRFSARNRKKKILEF
jgi:hypothetical protein